MKQECRFEIMIECQKVLKANHREGTKSDLENYSVAKHNATIIQLMYLVLISSHRQ